MRRPASAVPAHRLAGRLTSERPVCVAKGVTGGVAPGWYPDYEAPPGHQRYWNGAEWTERRSVEPSPRRRRAPALLAAAVLVAAAGAGVGAFGLAVDQEHPGGVPPPP